MRETDKLAKMNWQSGKQECSVPSSIPHGGTLENNLMSLYYVYIYAELNSNK